MKFYLVMKIEIKFITKEYIKKLEEPTDLLFICCISIAFEYGFTSKACLQKKKEAGHRKLLFCRNFNFTRKKPSSIQTKQKVKGAGDLV